MRNTVYSLIGFIFVFMFFALIVPDDIEAQSSDCGNGLIQRLSIGDRGWIDPTPPAQGVRMRQAPGEAEVARLQPSEEFTVLDGPQCYDTYSWFEIESDNGKRGWIAEGVEAGEYFVDPLLDIGPIDVDTRSCNSDPKTLTVGQYVEFTTDPTTDMLFYGHPLIKDAYFTLSSYFHGKEYEDSGSYLPYLGYPDNMSSNYLITDGPACVNGGYVWEVATHVAWFWLDEQYLRLSTEQPPVSPIFTPKRISLTEPFAPIVLAELQVDYHSGAGGGGGGTLQNVDDGCTLDPSLYPSSYEAACISVYPLRIGESVEVDIKQADGTVISSSSMNVEVIDLVVDGETFRLGGLRVPVPTKLGVTSGAYIIEVIGDVSRQQVAYRFTENYTSDVFAYHDKEPLLISYCESAEPILIGMNHAPNNVVELVYVELTQETGDIISGTYTFRELYKWTVNTGELGEFLTTIDLDLPSGYFVIADDTGDWFNNSPEIFGAFGDDNAPLATGLRGDCADNSDEIPNVIISDVVDTTVDYVLQNAKDYTSILGDVQEWTFTGLVDEMVTLMIKSDEMDVIAVLQDGEGNTLVEDDDSGQRTDALIEDFILPETGGYIVIVSSWGDKTGDYSIRLDTERALATPQQPKSTDVSVTQTPAPLPTDTLELVSTCAGAPPSRLDVGVIAQQALDNDPIRVREEPRSGTTILFMLRPGETVTVVDGPECRSLDTGDSLLWWQIENSDGTSGWVAEGTENQYFLKPVD